MIRPADATIARIFARFVGMISPLGSAREKPVAAAIPGGSEPGGSPEHPRAAKTPAQVVGKPRIVLCALETYSQIGGLQNFNQRVIASLAERAGARGEAAPVVLLRGDTHATLPALSTVAFHPHLRALDFVFDSIRAAVTCADIFVVCHIRLIPIVAVVRCLRPQLKILLFVHGREVWNQPIFPVRWYHPYFARALTRVVSVSSYTARIMAREYAIPETKFRLLPNAVDRIETRAGSRPRDKATILTVTRLGPAADEKNVDKMIRAVALLREKMPDLRYEIIGDGDMRPGLEALTREMGVDDIVTFLGRVDDATLKDAYARASLFALPSSQEGFGIVYLEAWQHGLPVICGAVGASAEIVADHIDGFVVDAENIAMIADRLYLLLSQPELARKMGERGRCKVEEAYLDPAFRKTLDLIIDELAAEAR